MKIRFHLLILLITIVFFFTSNGSYACGMKSTEMSCCKTESTSKKEIKDCCKSKNEKENNKPCGGKCGHSNCTTSSPSFTFIVTNEVKFSLNSIVLSTEKQKFYLNETTTSNGFFSLWLIPKIS